MGYRLDITVNKEIENGIDALKESIAPDDVYLYLWFMINEMSASIADIYNIDTELYTNICIEDPQRLEFFNLLAHYDNLIR